MTSVESKTVITLKGSVEIVSEFFFTAINSILYQRGELVYFVFLAWNISSRETSQYAASMFPMRFNHSHVGICFHISTGIYQPETFKREAKYGLTVLTTTDDGLLNYLNQVMGQMEAWLLDGNVQRLVVVVSGVDSGETLERWQFNVNVDDVSAASTGVNENQMQNGTLPAPPPKSMKQIHNEIQAIIRQITASVSVSDAT
jgi:mitotic spindle assembly checkpoint protein MAD2